jgi:hypothetical protein
MFMLIVRGVSKLKSDRKGRFLVWCAREDLNLHVLADTSPSSWRVYLVPPHSHDQSLVMMRDSSCCCSGVGMLLVVLLLLVVVGNVDVT